MSKEIDPDWQWRLQLTALVSEVKTNQDNLNEKLDSYVLASQTRLSELEASVYGRKEVPGLHEEVRDLKGRWAIFYGLTLLLVSAGVNIIVDSAVAKITKPVAIASVEDVPIK